MKVVLLNTSERTGGAAVAANRLLKALRKAGVEAAMLVRDRKTDDPAVVSVNRSFIARKINFIRFVWERLIIFICNGLSKKNLFQVSIANTGTDITGHPLIQAADVIHIHWINQGFLSLEDVRRLTATGKPIVWTLHDLWPATGVCHYPGGCERYLSACHDCPMMRRNPLFDLTAHVFRQKGGIGLRNINFVGCSHWIANEAKQGAWLREAGFTSIPNPIDISVFHPIAKPIARERFGLPENKHLLLFAAAKLSDTRKGFAFLIEACGRLEKSFGDRIEIVLMGSSPEEPTGGFPFKVNALGYISDPTSMAAAYAAADLFVIPSLEDNLPNTIMEAMACGTPCVGFDTGGIPEMIDHRRNGYIAAYQDADDLAAGIEWALTDRRTLTLGKACLDKVQACYQESVVANRYIGLYNRLITRS